MDRKWKWLGFILAQWHRPLRLWTRKRVLRPSFDQVSTLEKFSSDYEKCIQRERWLSFVAVSSITMASVPKCREPGQIGATAVRRQRVGRGYATQLADSEC